MELAPNVAPFVENAVQGFPAAAPLAAAPMAAMPMAAPAIAPSQFATVQMSAVPQSTPTQMMQVQAVPMQSQMMAVPSMAAPQMMLVPISPSLVPQQAQPSQVDPNSQPNQAPPPPYHSVPQSRPPMCDGNAAVFLDPLEEKLRRIEAAERRLQAQVAELQQVMKQLPNPTAVVPRGEQRSIPLHPLGPSSIRPTEAREPLAPPQPPPDLGQRHAVPTVKYSARPAGYYLEQPQPPPVSQVIREPGAPRALITGLNR
ncbi:hypothetical protein [Anatilimnocola aggregata]|nr:hypothetical protein [Anatilimnocola aggregata]